MRTDGTSTEKNTLTWTEGQARLRFEWAAIVRWLATDCAQDGEAWLDWLRAQGFLDRVHEELEEVRAELHGIDKHSALAGPERLHWAVVARRLVTRMVQFPDQDKLPAGKAGWVEWLNDQGLLAPSDQQIVDVEADLSSMLPS
jgi:hypothetical protein